MADQVLFYISSAPDLRHERDLLSRAVTEIPVTLGWRIEMTPGSGERVNEDAVAHADVHLLLLGVDVQAPMGHEWRLARFYGRKPLPFLRTKGLRTSAASDFIRFIAGQVEWIEFEDRPSLRLQALRHIGDHILEKADYYRLKPKEYEDLKSWRTTLDQAKPAEEDDTRTPTGKGGVILSPERYIPSEGVLLQPPQDQPEPEPESRRTGKPKNRP